MLPATKPLPENSESPPFFGLDQIGKAGESAVEMSALAAPSMLSLRDANMNRDARSRGCVWLMVNNPKPHGKQEEPN